MPSTRGHEGNEDPLDDAGSSKSDSEEVEAAAAAAQKRLAPLLSGNDEPASKRQSLSEKSVTDVETDNLHQAMNNAEPPAAGESGQCPICCQEIGAWAAARPETCEHQFCLECLTKWRRRWNACPLDRAPFDAVLVTQGPALAPIRVPMPPIPECQQRRQVQELDASLEFGVCAVCRIPYRPEPQNRDMVDCNHCGIFYHLQCLQLKPRARARATARQNLHHWRCEDCKGSL